ncbi:putative pyridine nucleotide-disulfide oxidoreductase AMID-like [Aspergillus lucknowensis]|uniref:FAD/NAD(P)-binding domain-containing protein n=1 Tax=Aspergillus lucknowensis TaxID=176173 RepID=A0ABR4LZJ3_9EURO
MPSFDEPQTPFKVLILGGSYAGLAAALNLMDLCHGRRNRFSIDEADKGTGRKIPVQVTIVDPRDGYYHLIGQPLALSSQKFAETFWVKYADIPALQTPNIRCVQGSISSLDCGSKTATITTAKGTIHEPYDYLITCTGLRREYPSAPRSLTREKYLAETAENLANVRDASRGVVVIGGGAVGIEIAAELKMLHPDIAITLIHSRAALLSSESLPAEFAAKTLEVLRASNINTLLGARVTSISEEPYNETQKGTGNGNGKEYTLTLSTGSTLTTSHVINAVSRFTPTAPSFLPADVCDEQGYIRVQPTLEFPADSSIPNAGDHYAAGDVARWSGIKRAGAAMHQGHYAARNIHQKMMQRVYGTVPEFVSLAEVEPGMGLALGKTAVGYFPGMGLSEGEETRELFFQGDLGFMICYKWMQLGTPMPTE